MRRRSNLSCTLAVALDCDASHAEVQALARYLSTLNLNEYEVLVLDGSSSELFEERHTLLRWVCHHHPVLPHCRFIDGRIDLLQAASELASTEKIIIATTDSRYTGAEMGGVCALLDHHDVVEPEEYFHPLPWWGAVDAGRILLHRAITGGPRGRCTFAFRRAAFLPVRDVPDRSGRNETTRLVLQGAEVHQARGIFVRREPQRFRTWLGLRSRQASAELAAPLSTIFFLSFAPLLVALSLMGRARMTIAAASLVVLGSVLLAWRGRAGAGRFFPMHVCLFAPLWIAERSLSVYWALFDQIRGATAHPATPSPLRTRTRAASGE